MGVGNRDWHRDWWSKKTGYVERARFRMSEADYQRQLIADKRRKRFVWLAVLLALFFTLFLLWR